MRIKNSLNNMFYSLLMQFVSLILSFLNRYVFILVLGATYLGINGLFSNLLSMLNLAELGIGSAIIYALYKPLANKDEENISKLMNYYKRAYTIISFLVLTFGLLLMPFLGFFIKQQPDIPNFQLIYVLYLFNSAITYLFSYKSSILLADQKNHIIIKNTILINVVFAAVKILLLYLFKNFILILIFQIATTLLQNIIISSIAQKHYPFLKKYKHSYLDKQQVKSINSNIKALSLHKIGYFIVTSTDNIIISKFIGLIPLGIYSNYVLIVSSVDGLISLITNSISASIGNYIVSEDGNKTYNIFKIAFFANYILTTLCTVILYVTVNPFIKIWIGDNYLLGSFVVNVILIEFYITGMRRITDITKSAAGLFRPDRFVPLIESLINLAASLIFVNFFGIAGVLMGTILSTILTCLWTSPYFLYKIQFKRKLRSFFLMYIIYTFVMLTALFSSAFICDLFYVQTNIFTLLARGITGFLICTIIIVICFYNTLAFKYLLKFANKSYKKINRKQEY
jgi:O-antigen/teichoic acid export membrane protein